MHSGTAFTPTVARSLRGALAVVVAGLTVSCNGDKLTGITSGSIALSVSGLPSTVNGAVDITGPGNYTRTLQRSETLTGLPPGSYTVTAAPFVVQATTYTPTPSSQQVVVTASTVPAPVAVSYSAVLGDDLVVAFAYVTQVVQRRNGTVPLVAGRTAVLRVFVTNSRDIAMTPAVRATIYQDDAVVQTVLLEAPEASVRSEVAEDVTASSWNAIIPAEIVRPGLRILVEVDPANAISEVNETNNVWPLSGTPRSVTVVDVPSFDVRFVPVTLGETTGRVSEANKDEFLVSLTRMFPVRTINADVRLPFTSSPPTDRVVDPMLNALNEMHALRFAEGAPANLHYYGVLQNNSGAGFAGFASIGGRAAVGHDALPAADLTAAHEWGHNFNRRHSPCGVEQGVDPAYPHPGGTIGAFGWNEQWARVVPAWATDVMGYCRNQLWISDWTWTHIMTYRSSVASVVDRSSENVMGSDPAAADGLLVWGQISGKGITLEPAFRVNAAPTAPSTGGSHRVEALDRSGQRILSLAIDALAIDHATEPGLRHFAVVLPWSARLERSLATLRVVDIRSPIVAAARSSAAALSATNVAIAPDAMLQLGDPAEAMEVAGADRLRMRWDQAQYPMAMVRDVATGQVLAFLRRSGADIVAKRGRPVDVVFSDGVRSVVRRHQQ